MKVDIFDFELDRSLIAKQPASPRDTSRLLDLSEEDKIADRRFYDLPDILRKGDVLVFNDTKVIPARLYGARGDARVEVTLYRPVDGVRWWSFVKNAKRLHPGDTVRFYTDDITPEESGFTASVIEKKEDDGVLIAFDCPPEQLASDLQKYGLMPLPPYIKRDKPAQGGIWDKYNDKENYQTIYARFEGAVAAPTAGLHFTDRVFRALEEKGVEKVFVTLHVGAGTFLPVKTADTKDHKMHTEYCEISPEACDAVNQGRGKKNHRRRHHLPQAAGNRGRRTGRAASFRRRHRHFHHARIQVPRNRHAHHQLPPAEVDFVHADLRGCRHRKDESGLPSRD